MRSSIYFSRIFFPEKCIHCRKIIPFSDSFCHRCSLIECRTPESFCFHCNSRECRCQEHNSKLRHLTAPFLYTDAAKELIRDGKMSGTIKQDAEGMAEALLMLAKNGLSGSDLMQGTEAYHVDQSVDKLRISYSKYLGE